MPELVSQEYLIYGYYVTLEYKNGALTDVTVQEKDGSIIFSGKTKELIMLASIDTFLGAKLKSNDESGSAGGAIGKPGGGGGVQPVNWPATHTNGNNCPVCGCLYDDKMKGAQGRNANCECPCGHNSRNTINGSC